MKAIKKIIAFAVFVAVAIWIASGAIYALFPLKYENIVEECSAKYGLSEYLVYGTIYAESGFHETAHSKVAHGLMQITDETAQWIAKQMGIDETLDLEDARTNIEMGCWYLSYLMGMYEEADTALAAYNAGLGNVTKWLNDEEYSQDGKKLKKIPYSETEQYVKRVRLYTYIYEKLYGKN